MNIFSSREKKITYEMFLLYGLFFLLIIRISIDYLGLFITLHIPLLGTLSLSQLFALSVIPLMFYFFFFHFRRTAATPFLFPFFLIIAIDLITMPFSPIPNTTLALYEVLRMLSIIFLFVLSHALITTPQKFQTLIRVIINASWIPLIFAAVQLLLGIGYSDVAFTELRIFGSFTHPNVYGTYLLVVITAILINLSLTSSRRTKIYSLILLALNFLALTLTFTRIAWLMAILIITLYLLIKDRILAFLFFIIIIAAYLGIPEIHERVHEATILSPDNSLVWRFNLWHDTVYYTTRTGAVLFGNGTGTFMDVADTIRGNLFGDREPHNEFVRAYVENGLVGLGAYLLYILTMLTVTLRAALHATSQDGRKTFFLLGLLFLALTIASTTDHVLRSTPLQWTLMAMLGGALATFFPHTSHHHTRRDT